MHMQYDFAHINCNKLWLAHVCPVTFHVVWKTSLLPQKLLFFFARSQRCFWFKAEGFGKLSIRLSVWRIVLMLKFSRAAVGGMSDRCAWLALRGSGKSKEQFHSLTCDMIFRFQKTLFCMPTWRCIAAFCPPPPPPLSRFRQHGTQEVFFFLASVFLACFFYRETGLAVYWRLRTAKYEFHVLTMRKAGGGTSHPRT